MIATATSLSVFEAPPLETGGIVARQGFAFQDHVAAGYLLDLWTEPELSEVWCETQDDATLIWVRGSGVHAEYVQSKNTSPDQLWSVALLCERGSKGEGHSILEKSLAYDRCRETCGFRLVTSCDVAKALRPLTYPFDSAGRSAEQDDVKDLYADVGKRLGTYRSPNGRGYSFWLDNAMWEVRFSDATVKAANLLKLSRILNGIGNYLAVDQVEELYARILKRVEDASLADANMDRNAKRIKKADFSTWLLTAARTISVPVVGASTLMEGKMGRALLAPDVILLALEQRRSYVEGAISEKYLSLDHRKLIESEVAAVLQRLKSRLDTGAIPDDGVAFHELCLAELEALRNSIGLDPRPPLSVFQGCMYNMAGRCVHRFRRATA